MGRRSQQALLSFSKEISCRLNWLITLLTDNGALQKNTLTVFIKWCRLTYLHYFYGEWNCIYKFTVWIRKGYLQDFLATASFEACSVLDRFFFLFFDIFSTKKKLNKNNLTSCSRPKKGVYNAIYIFPQLPPPSPSYHFPSFSPCQKHYHI